MLVVLMHRDGIGVLISHGLGQRTRDANQHRTCNNLFAFLVARVHVPTPNQALDPLVSTIVTIGAFSAILLLILNLVGPLTVLPVTSSTGGTLAVRASNDQGGSHG